MPEKSSSEPEAAALSALLQEPIEVLNKFIEKAEKTRLALVRDELNERKKLPGPLSVEKLSGFTNSRLCELDTRIALYKKARLQKEQSANTARTSVPGVLEGTTAGDSNSEEHSAPQRLCYWRDPGNNAFDGFPPEKTGDADARYRYERAQAEVLFQKQLDDLAGVQHSPNDLLMAANLENYVGFFLHHSLSAFGDLLLDRRTPGTDALRAFDQHLTELLPETFNGKWVFGVRHLELEGELTSDRQFWDAQKENLGNVRREFEKLLWNTELEEIAAPGQVDEAECKQDRVVQPLEESPSPGTGQRASETERRAMVDAFILKLANAGQTITRTNIWTVAGYKHRTEFERFQRGDVRTTRSAVSNFNRVLSMEAEDFISALKKRTSPK